MVVLEVVSDSKLAIIDNKIAVGFITHSNHIHERVYAQARNVHEIGLLKQVDKANYLVLTNIVIYHHGHNEKNYIETALRLMGQFARSRGAEYLIDVCSREVASVYVKHGFRVVGVFSTYDLHIVRRDVRKQLWFSKMKRLLSN